ncbi:MAG: hypothetical protein JST26_10315, partial [Bacteroidetes bacterium]|nr:hypothetical protein [Bacteroidota bacterium]
MSVDVATLTNMNGNTLYIGYDNSDGTPWLDWSQPVTSASTGTYIYYIIPKTNVGNLFFNIDNSSATNFDFELDNIKIDLIGGAMPPLYTAVLNNVTDYYAFGAPMPGRNFTST